MLGAIFEHKDARGTRCPMRGDGGNMRLDFGFLGEGMAENIYSNPSGFTEIPWEFSLQYFAGLAIAAIQADEAALNSARPRENHEGGPSECENCGMTWKPGASVCDTCMRPIKASDITSENPNERLVLLAQEDYHLLTCEPSHLQALDEKELVSIHNLLVESLRQACQDLLASGEQPVKVREGLDVPREWDAHYRNLWPTQPKCLIWIAARHAVLGNPLKGELFEWTNTGAKQTKSGVGVKIAGAAAVGVLAGFLFG